VLRSTCAGVSASSLVDTGATANFASQDLADKCDAQVKLLKRPRSVRLGNNTVQMITHYIDTTTWIGDNKFAITYLVMPKLPTGVDSILSMAWLVAEDLWLHPKTKRIVRHSSDGKSAMRVLASLTVHDTSNKDFVAFEPTSASRNKMRTDTESHDSKPPLGLYALRPDDPGNHDEVVVVTSKNFNLLKSKMETNSLNHEYMDKFISQGKHKSHHAHPPPTENTQSEPAAVDADAEFPQTSNPDHDEDSFILDLRFHPNGSFGITTENGKKMSPKQTSAFLNAVREKTGESVNHIEIVPPESSRNKTQYASQCAFITERISPSEEMDEAFLKADIDQRLSDIHYPDGFRPSMIDATYKPRSEWVAKLKAQEIMRVPAKVRQICAGRVGDG